MWTNAGKVTRGYTSFQNMREVIHRIKKMTHMDKRSLTNDAMIVNKVHKLAGDYYHMLIGEEFLVKKVTHVGGYTDYNSMKELIRRLRDMTDIKNRTFMNDAMILNKIYDLLSVYCEKLDEEYRAFLNDQWYQAENRKKG
jgi:hypothetical protein